MKSRLGPFLLLVFLAGTPMTAAAQSIWIVSDNAEDPTIRYLEVTLPEASVRRELTTTDARARPPQEAGTRVLVVDFDRGVLQVMEAGQAELTRVFDPELAASHPYAIAVVAAELLSLPDMPLPPTEEQLAAAETLEGTETQQTETQQTETQQTETVSQDADSDAELVDGAETQTDFSADPQQSNTEVTSPWRFGLSTSVYAQGTLGVSGQLLLLRPSLEVGIHFGHLSLRISGHFFGTQSETMVPTLSGAELNYTRNSAAALLGVHTVGDIRLGVSAGMTLAWTSATVIEGTSILAEASRLAPLFSASVDAEFTLISRLALLVRLKGSLDPGARRYRIEQNTAFEERDVLVDLELGLTWYFLP